MHTQLCREEKRIQICTASCVTAFHRFALYHVGCETCLLQEIRATHLHKAMLSNIESGILAKMQSFVEYKTTQWFYILRSIIHKFKCVNAGQLPYCLAVGLWLREPRRV